MTIIRPPEEYVPAIQQGSRKAIFLAGSVSGSENWRLHIAQSFEAENVVFLDPFNASYASADAAAFSAQIEWERRHLRRAWGRVFWFSFESLCAMSLFELGASCQSAGPLFVGCHADYRLRRDVISQLAIARPDVVVAATLDELISQLRDAVSVAWATSP